MFEYLVLKHSKHPKGFFGKIMSGIFDKANVYQNKQTLQLLDIQEDDEIVELGFGSGCLLVEMAQQARKGKLVGVEHSKTMIKDFAKKHKPFIDSGLVELIHSKLEGVTDRCEQFDKVCLSNTLYFFENLEDCFKPVLSLLKKGGRAVIAFRVQEGEGQVRTKHGYTHYNCEEVKTSLEKLGFESIEMKELEQSNGQASWKLIWFICNKP